MEDIRCDVLVVGAGPAGSSLAAVLAEDGIDTVVAERKMSAGVPTRCAEFVPKGFAGLYEKRLDCILRRIRSMKTFVENELVSELDSPGFIIERKSLIQENIKRFEDNSGRYLPSTRILKVTKDRKQKLKAVAIKGGRPLDIYPEIIVGAAGISSPVSKSMGYKGFQDYILGINQQIEIKPYFDDKSTRVFFSRRICRGYGWIFPKKKTANFGIGLSTAARKGNGPAYKKVLVDLARDILGPDYRPVSPAASGLIPVGGLRQRLVDNGKILIGDEAGLCNPVTGAGIYNAVLSANIAASFISRAVKTGDIKRLSGISHRFSREFFPHLERALDKRKYLKGNWEAADFEALIRKSWPAFRDYWQ